MGKCRGGGFISSRRHNVVVAAALLSLPALVVGPAVAPLSFITVPEYGELVGSSVGQVEDELPCCQEANLATCVKADIKPAALGRQGSLALPNDIVVVFEGHVGGNRRSFAYRSAEDGGGDASVVITCSEKTAGCHGEAVSDNGDRFVLEYCGPEHGHVWKQVNIDNLADEEPVWDEEENSLVGANEEGDDDDDVDVTTHVVYSIKFYYTSAFAAVTPDIDGFIDQAITKTNQAYINSGVPLETYALCKEEAVGLEESDSASEMLKAFENFKQGGSEELRDTADAAVLLVKQFSACGIGRLASFGSGDTISVVMKSCAEGSYTVAHEVGHNFGLTHDPANAKTLAYPYGTGHLIEQGRSKDPKGFRTIMAYAAEGHKTRVNHFSNPGIKFKPTGTATGTAISNNARVLLRNRFKVAAVGDESSTQCFVWREDAAGASVGSRSPTGDEEEEQGELDENEEFDVEDEFDEEEEEEEEDR